MRRIQTTDRALFEACKGNRKLENQLFAFKATKTKVIDGKKVKVHIFKFPKTYLNSKGKIPMKKGDVVFSVARLINAKGKATQHGYPKVYAHVSKILKSL